MRDKPFITHGTLVLALTASVFIGCQEFLGADKGDRPATPSRETLQPVAQAVPSQDTATAMPVQPVEKPATAATDAPAQAVEAPVTVVTPAPDQPSPSPVSTAPSPQQQECLDVYNALQTLSEKDGYGQAKDQYSEKDCDRVLGDLKPVPPPPTLADRCKMYRLNLTQTQPTGDPKWAAYLAEMAIECAAYP